MNIHLSKNLVGRCRRAKLQLVSLLLPFAACTSLSARQRMELGMVPQEDFRLRLVGDTLSPSEASFEGSPIGGLSSIVWDPRSERLLALSDDRSEKAPARLFRFKLSFDPKAGAMPQIQVESVLKLTDASGKPFPRTRLDPEGLALNEEGEVLVSSEGDARLDPRLPPEVLEFRTDGRLRRSWGLPAHFAPEASGDQKTGARNNMSLEALTKVPAMNTWYAAMESALVQDDAPADYVRASRARLVRFTRKTPDAAGEVDAEYVIAIDPLPAAQHPPAASPGDIGFRSTGISDLVALDEHQLLALERTVQEVKGSFQHQVRLYLLDLSGARNVVGQTSLKTLKPELADSELVRKKLLLDFDSLLPRLSESYRVIDNFEGVCFGPKLPNGNLSLIALADDNFSKSQRTQWLVFEVVPGSE